MNVLKILNPVVGLVVIILFSSGIALENSSLESAYIIHKISSISFIILSGLHIYLNRKWIITTYFKKKK